jgi:hypothetical protein
MSGRVSTNDMVLAYNAKRRVRRTAISEGNITRLYFLPYEGEHMFEIDEGECRSSWVKLGDDSWFVVGWRARIEHTLGKNPEVLGIWIGKSN